MGAPMLKDSGPAMRQAAESSGQDLPGASAGMQRRVGG